VQVQQRRGRGSFQDLGAPITVRNVRGYFKARFRLSGASRRTYRLVSGGEVSPRVKAVTVF
jgi:hypothetical protein